MGQTKLSGPLMTSVLCLLAVVVVLLFQLPPVARAVFMPGSNGGFVEEIDQYRTEHESTLEGYQARFDGRSVFFKPLQPKRVAPPPPPREIVKTPSRETTPPPAPEPRKPSYAGPKIMAMVGDEVWFHGKLRVRVGEEKQGIKVLSTDAPWSAAVMYSGWEYEVPLWDRIELPFEQPDESSTAATMPGLVEVATPAPAVAPTVPTTAPATPVAGDDEPKPQTEEVEAATKKPVKDDEEGPVAGADDADDDGAHVQVDPADGAVADVRKPAAKDDPNTPTGPPDSPQ